MTPTTAAAAPLLADDLAVNPNMPLAAPKIAVLVPCYNEAATVAQVVRDFRAALPGASVFVYDNNSDDRTVQVAREAGAFVRAAPLQGKGEVMRLMFADVDADVYVLVDGDATYEAAAAPRMIAKLIDERLDMVSGARVSDAQEAYRAGHRFGNAMLTGLVRQIFGRRFKDMLTGYRVFSRRFVKSFPASSRGFETETELTVHALQMRLPAGEIDTAYGARPEGSTSKLSTIRDGVRILAMIGLLVREERPLPFFSVFALWTFALAFGLTLPLAHEYLRTGLVPRFPTLVVSVGFAVVGLLSLVCGLILDTVSRARLEQRRLAYLAIPGPGVLRWLQP